MHLTERERWVRAPVEPRGIPLLPAPGCARCPPTQGWHRAGACNAESLAHAWGVALRAVEYVLLGSHDIMNPKARAQAQGQAG
eukprot:3597948-Pyramimonas_sp.AAC.1